MNQEPKKKRTGQKQIRSRSHYWTGRGEGDEVGSGYQTSDVQRFSRSRWIAWLESR